LLGFNTLRLMNESTKTKATMPVSIAVSEYEALHSNPQRWEPILSEIAEAHGLGRFQLRAVENGSNLVALLGGDLVIKLFPPFLRHQYESERLTLQHLRGRLSTRIPETVVDGETAGWPYLIMSQLEGVPLSHIWGSCTSDEKRTILHAVGKLIAEVQAVPPGSLTTLEPAWQEFIASQTERCRSTHERLGLPQRLLEQIDPYLTKTRYAVPDGFRPAILTGEYTPGNLLMSRRAGAWQISGLIDFGDVMVGFKEYDLLGPSTFLASGDVGQVRALLSGFGYDDVAATRGLSERLMRLLLLHRYSNFDVQVRIEGWQNRVRDLDELALLLWPLNGADS
jgi:hygromycin-B 7''-O-kinase